MLDRWTSWWTGQRRDKTNQITVLTNVEGHISSVRVHIYNICISPRYSDALIMGSI